MINLSPLNIEMLEHPLLTSTFCSLGIVGSIASAAIGVGLIVVGLGLAPFTFGLSADAAIGIGGALVVCGFVGFISSLSALRQNREFSRCAKFDLATIEQRIMQQRQPNCRPTAQMLLNAIPYEALAIKPYCKAYLHGIGARLDQPLPFIPSSVPRP